MTDQSHFALEVDPAGLSVAQKHQCRLVMDPYFVADGMVRTVGNPSRAFKLFGYQLLISQAASRFIFAVAWLQCDKAFHKAASREPA